MEDCFKKPEISGIPFFCYTLDTEIICTNSSIITLIMTGQEILKKSQKILEECEAKNARLCIAAKTQHPENLAYADVSPRIVFAENRVQEAESKLEFYQKIPNVLHLIGPLQKNKVRKAVKIFDVIQTVDSLSLLRKIDEISGEEEKMVKIFLNVNISQDEHKTGFTLDEVIDLVKELKKNPHKNIVIAGLFTILKNHLPETEISRYYGLMKQLFDGLKTHFGPQFSELSMGMSGDYALALEQGATIVRVGSGIFGKRG